MKISVILLSFILFVGLGFSQESDSIKVAKDDWRFLRQTSMELDSALTECEYMNNLYERRLTEFQAECYDLEQANKMADSIMTAKDNQLDDRKEQVDLLKMELKKKKLEIWMYRGGGILLIVAGVLLVK